MGRRIDLDTHALLTNLMANAIIVLTLSLSLWPCLARLIRLGSIPFGYPGRYSWIIVPGHSLESGQPSTDFRARLDRAADLAHRVPDARILILGGIAPGQPRSEAAAGRDYLVTQSIAQERIHLEHASRNTLENFQCAVSTLRGHCGKGLVLVTNRYHLARSEILARNLGLRTEPCPAEIDRMPQLLGIRRILWETYLLHWYHVGRIYAVLTGNKAMLSRIHDYADVD